MVFIAAGLTVIAASIAMGSGFILGVASSPPWRGALWLLVLGSLMLGASGLMIWSAVLLGGGYHNIVRLATGWLFVALAIMSLSNVVHTPVQSSVFVAAAVVVGYGLLLAPQTREAFRAAGTRDA